MGSPLGKSVSWGVALLCGLLLANGYLSFRNLQLVRSNMLRADDARQAMMALDDVLALTLDLETAARGYAITGVPKYLKPYEDASEALTRSLERATDSLNKTGNEGDAVELKARVRKRYELARQLVATRRDESFEAAQAFVESGVGRKQMDAVRSYIVEVRRLEVEKLAYWTGRSDTSYRTALVSLLNATAGGIVLIGAVYYLIRRENIQRHQAAETIRQLNRNLEERVHELETLLELMPIGIAIAKDPQCHDITTNPACAEMLGLERGANASFSADADQRPRNYRILQDGVELSVNNLPLQRCVASGKSILGEEVEIVRSDGVTLKLLQYVAPLFDEQNAVRGGVGVFIDVTERVKLAQELREHASVLEDQQLWLQSLLDLLPVPLLLIEQPSGSARFANRSAKNAGDSLMVVNAEPANADAAVPCTDAAGLPVTPERMPLARIARGDRLDHYELTWHSTNGSKSILINADSLPAMHSHPPIAVMVFQDITQLKLIETELRRTNQAKDALLAMLGHELRNPLAAITGATDVVATHAPDERPYQTALDILKRHVGHLTQLVDDMLDLTRLTTGRIRLRSKPLDLREPLTHAVQAAQSLIASRQHTLHVDLPDAPVWLVADQSRLEQIFSNLLVNAAKYTDPGGRIDLRLTTTDRRATVSVRDNGIGIAADKISRLFDLFAQVDPALDRSQSGLGIGLTVVKNLVELHGGDVEARSDGLGKGSEFVVRLPLAERKGALPSAATPAPAVATRPLKILLVEDNPDIAHVLIALIKRCGHHPTWADSGPAALDAVQSWVPDLGLLDIGLPGMSGYELAAALRSRESLSKTPLVALTGFGQDEDRSRSQAAGFARHLVKPISIDTLKQVFQELCG